MMDQAGIDHFTDINDETVLFAIEPDVQNAVMPSSNRKCFCFTNREEGEKYAAHFGWKLVSFVVKKIPHGVGGLKREGDGVFSLTACILDYQIVETII